MYQKYSHNISKENRYYVNKQVKLSYTDDGEVTVTTSNSKTYLLGKALAECLDVLTTANTSMNSRQLLASLDGWSSPQIEQAIQLLLENHIITYIGNVEEEESCIQYRPPLTWIWKLFDPVATCLKLKSLAIWLVGWRGIICALIGIMLQLFQISSVQIDKITPTDVVIVSLLFMPVIILHELAHAIVLTAEGGQPKKMGIMLFMFIPSVFCDVSDGWHLTKKSRISVALAGVISQCQIGGIIAVTPFLINETVIIVAIFSLLNIISALFNMLPFFKLDGYYVISAWLDIPNLSFESRKCFTEIVQGRRRTGKNKLRIFLIIYSLMYEIAQVVLSFFVTISIVKLLFPNQFYLHHFSVVFLAVVWMIIVGLKIFDIKEK